MRIALVAPSSVPFVLGGAERLWWGLASEVNRHTSHAMELIKLPSPERDFWEVADSYRRFSELDLGHFDCVISTKYPAWMVAHGNHIVYMQHRLRGLYDTYPPHLPLVPKEVPAPAAKLWDLLQRDDLDRAALPDVFAAVDALRHQSIRPDVRERLVAFPGPLSRALVHALDRIALAPGSIRRYVAISKTVAQRAGYFPENTEVEVVPHPSDLTGFHEAPGEFVFTASRLDGAKRVDLLVNAYRRARTTVPLVIAGEGPAEADLRSAACGDARIRFVGRLTDEGLLSHYARSHFVAFVPFQEDMGLVTLEAMQSAKPVLTVTDAGGVTEFVRDGHNGRIVPPEAEPLARAIDAMLADRDRLSTMGRNAKSIAEEVTWKRTIDVLLDDAPRTSGGGEKPPSPATWRRARDPSEQRTRVLALNTFPVFPPTSGGRKRIFYLYRHLAQRADVTLLNIDVHCGSSEIREFGGHFREIRVPPDERFRRASAKLHRLLGRSVEDIAAMLFATISVALNRSMRSLVLDCDVVVASHAYLAPLVAAHWTGEIWYDAHNVEADMKADVLGVPRLDGPIVGADERKRTEVVDASTAVRRVAEVEGALVASAARVFAASEDDRDRLSHLYGRARDGIELVPNGVAIPDDPWLEPHRRESLKARVGLAGRPVALFAASDHGPNHEAARLIVAAARACPRWTFIFAGSICDAAAIDLSPENILRMGVLSEQELRVLLRCADVGLNPMLRGSGTNLKVLDYAGHGALVVSTDVGARGLGFVVDRHYVSIEPGALADALSALEGEAPGPRSDIRHAARRHVEEHYSWKTIADRIALPPRGVPIPE